MSHLSKAFNCSALYFDDYASRKDFPSDLSAWIRDGGDPNEPEVALGRRIHDLIQYLRNDSEVLINLLDHFLFDYLYRGVRDMYIEIGKKVKANSDLIINANKNIEEIASSISELIRKKKEL